jgi:hypothetical protein
MSTCTVHAYRGCTEKTRDGLPERDKPGREAGVSSPVDHDLDQAGDDVGKGDGMVIVMT